MGIVRVRILNMILAAIYLGAGLSKLFGPGEMREIFFAWGYPDWFRFLIGGMEVVGAGCLLIPPAVPGAVALLGAIMLGAIGTHLRSDQAPYALIPLVLFALLTYVGIDAWRNRTKV